MREALKFLAPLLILPSTIAFTIQSTTGCPSFVNRSPITVSDPSSHRCPSPPAPLQMSFYSDSSDYKSSDSDFTSDDEPMNEYGVPIQEDGDESPSEEITPVPMSKNSGNRFVAFVFDKALTEAKGEEVDVMELHRERIKLTEEHVVFCRKMNLYNETFNTDSMSDILWSHQILSSDLQRTVGHVMCIESTTVEYARDTLSRDPLVLQLTNGDISSIPFYRWRQLRDFTLRNDDGRDGRPTLLLAMDRSAEDGVGDIREKVENDHLEYLIRSNRIIATGPLHFPTEFKDDPSSIPLGTLILFNADGREDAVEFVENDPYAKEGLYESMRVFRYNSIDVTGKFCAKNLLDDSKNSPTGDLKEAMEYWGYPVDDMQTRWLNS